ncbi:MAG TPA: hypothetical protein VGF06_15505 [Terriglobales bacterium]|jgi:hypothetical protein
MNTFRRIVPLAFLLSCTVLACAQSDRDYQQACRAEAARRLNLSRDRVDADMSGSDQGRVRVQWRGNGRYGYCLLDRRMNVVEFKDFGTDRNGRDGDRRDDDWDNDGGRWRPISEYPRLAVDTDGHGSFKRENQNLRIRRGYVNTRETPSVSLSCDKNYRVTFRGDMVQANGDREFVLRFTSSDRGDARGLAKFRLNSDRNEVEFISIRGRLNGRPVEATFDRNQ